MHNLETELQKLNLKEQTSTAKVQDKTTRAKKAQVERTNHHCENPSATNRSYASSNWENLKKPKL